MGYAARLNPRSFDGTEERTARNARLERFCRQFPDLTALERYLKPYQFEPEAHDYVVRLWTRLHTETIQ